MEEHVKIKICGITKQEEIDTLNDAKVDYAGFVFYEKSKRNITADKAAALKAALDASIKSVAVTVSPDVAVIKMLEDTGFDIIQIHGDLNREVLECAHVPLWRAVNAGSVDEAEKLIRDEESFAGKMADKIVAFVFDAPSFGSGVASDWSGARRPDTKKLYVLAGGLNASNVAEGIGSFHPDIVDVSSSVEGESGKDAGKIYEFVNTVRKVTDNE